MAKPTVLLKGLAKSTKAAVRSYRAKPGWFRTAKKELDGYYSFQNNGNGFTIVQDGRVIAKVWYDKGPEYETYNHMTIERLLEYVKYQFTRQKGKEVV